MELHHGKERKECERMECKSGISCEKAFLDRERSVDAFCVKMKFSCAVGKKSGRNVIKEKFVVCSSIAFLFVFFPLSSFFQVEISFEANYLIAPNSFFFMHLHYT